MFAAALCLLAACDQQPTRPTAARRAVQAPSRDASTLGGAIDLGSLGGRYIQPFALNDAGVAIGLANDATGVHIWTSSNGAWMQRGPGYVADGSWGEPRAIDNYGDIAGWRATPDGGQVAFIVGPHQAERVLPTPAPSSGPVESEAAAVAASNSAAGWYTYDANGDHRAVAWMGAGPVQLGSLVFPDGVQDVSCEATGMNAADEVVGFCADQSGLEERAFFWSTPTQMKDLGVTGEARAINNSNQIVGYATYDDNGDSRAFIWSPGGDHGTLQLVPLPEGVVSVRPLTINDKGLIGGECSKDGSRYTACAGTASGTDWFVSDVFEERSAIVSINDEGLALGYIDMPDATRAVEWQLGGSSKPADTTPPVITPTLAGTLGLDGWNTSNVGLTWSETDPESNVASTSGCDPVTVSSDTKGTTYTCSATNGAGLSAQATVTIERDATPPSIVFHGNAGSYTVDQRVAISCTASDATSGLASSTCANVAGDAYTFALGPNAFTATATDVAGNTASASVSFRVEVTFASLGNLTRRWVSNIGVANSLCAKLDAAAHGSAQSKPGKLAAYVHELQAQTGKTISADEAAILERLAGAV